MGNSNAWFGAGEQNVNPNEHFHKGKLEKYGVGFTGLTLIILLLFSRRILTQNCPRAELPEKKDFGSRIEVNISIEDLFLIQKIKFIKKYNRYK